MEIARLVLYSLLAYLVGSVPFSYLVARARGVDIRTVGSGNVGATNVARSVGYPWGALALLLDAAKGVLSASLSGAWSLPLWPAAFAVVGHNWSLFMGMKSGKGVATSLGILFVVSWPVALVAIALWGLIASLTRTVSVASVASLLSSPLLLWLGGSAPGTILLMAGLGLLAAFQHRENFQRLLEGTERRLG